MHDEGTDAVTRIRRLGALTLATVLASTFLIFGASLPASAASLSVSIHGSQVKVTGTGDGLESRIIVIGPSGNQSTLDSYPLWQQRQLSGGFTAEINGAYTAKVQHNVLGFWGDLQTRPFTVKAAPAAPSGLLATATGGKVNVLWNLGNETDLTGYGVSVGGASKTGSTASFCSGSTCSTSVATSATGPVNVTVTARRSGGTSASSSTSVTIGGSSGGGNQSPNLPAGTGTTNVPLSPVNGGSPYNLPNVAPEGSNPNFAYPTPPPQVANQLSPKATDFSADSPALQWAKSIAIALVLLLCAGHLGTWTRRLRLAQATGPRASRLGRARVSVAQARIAQAEAVAKAGALSKEAVLGQDSAEAKTKKGLLGRKKSGRDQAGIESPLETATETAVLELAPDAAEASAPNDHNEATASGSVEEALAALTRGSETRVEFEEFAMEEFLADPAEHDASAELEPIPARDVITSEDTRTGGRSRLGRGSRGRRRAK